MIIKKVLRTIRKKRIRLYEYINTGFYMKRYTKFLKKYGMNITGMPRYISPSVFFDGYDYSIISIGDRTVISKEVVFLTHDFSIARGLEAIGEHNPNPNKDEFYLKGISVGKNCFIGYRSMLLPGTSIGDNCIIGAGAIVKGKIPNNSIVIGNPGKVYSKTDEWARKKLLEHEYTIEK